MKTFKTACGCEIRVIKWSQKANSVTMKFCSLHRAAQGLFLAATKSISLLELGFHVGSGACGKSACVSCEARNLLRFAALEPTKETTDHVL